MNACGQVPLVLSIALACCQAAAAQTVVCLDQQSGQVDANATQAFADMQGRMDAGLAQAMAGTWYSETQSPATGQTSALYVTYGSDGSLSYQNRVCDQTGACSDYQGQGAWAALPLGGGQFSGIQMISDQGRNQLCSGFSGTFVDQTTIQSGAGGVSRKVR